MSGSQKDDGLRSQEQQPLIPESHDSNPEAERVSRSASDASDGMPDLVSAEEAARSLAASGQDPEKKARDHDSEDPIKSKIPFSFSGSIRNLSTPARILGLLLLALLGGGAAAGITYGISFILPGLAVVGVPSLLGLTGIGIPLVLAGIVGAFVTLALLTLLERNITGNKISTGLFVALVLLSGVAFAALGVLVVAMTPAVFSTLSFGLGPVFGPLAALGIVGASLSIIAMAVMGVAYRRIDKRAGSDQQPAVESKSGQANDQLNKVESQLGPAAKTGVEGPQQSNLSEEQDPAPRRSLADLSSGDGVKEEERKDQESKAPFSKDKTIPEEEQEALERRLQEERAAPAGDGEKAADVNKPPVEEKVVHIRQTEDVVLPPGWHFIKADDGKDYYWNDDTQESSWERPTDGPQPRN